MAYDETILRHMLTLQRDEITGYETYLKLAQVNQDAHNREVLEHIAQEEMGHYLFWKSRTGEDVGADKLKVWFYTWIARIFGLTFGLKLMERGEAAAQVAYAAISSVVPEVQQVLADEEAHEAQLLNMLDEEGLKYAGSIVLGLNDALVELTGALAGFSFALQNTQVIALVGLITGISASLSMAASEYLSTKSDDEGRDALKSALYTGGAYVFTVIMLILPYFLFTHYMVSLGATVFNAIAIIAVFNFYIAVAKDLSFRERFLEMAGISLGVTALSFGVGVLVKHFLGVDI